MSKQYPEAIKIEFEIAYWVEPFLKEYLGFLGRHGTSIGDVAREAFWEEICKIRDELRGLVWFDRKEFFEKNHRIATLENREEAKHHIEMENDC